MKIKLIVVWLLAAVCGASADSLKSPLRSFVLKEAPLREAMRLVSGAAGTPVVCTPAAAENAHDTAALRSFSWRFSADADNALYEAHELYQDDPVKLRQELDRIQKQSPRQSSRRPGSPGLCRQALRDTASGL